MVGNNTKKERQISLIKYIAQTLLMVIPLSTAAGALMSVYIIRVNGLQLKLSIACYLGASLALGILASLRNYKKFINPLNEIKELAKNLKNSNITYLIDTKKAEGQAEIIGSLNESVSSLRNTVREVMNVGTELAEAPLEMKKSLQVLGNISDQVAKAVSEVAQGATEQARSVENVSASISDIVSGLNKIEEDIKDAEKLAENALDTVKTGEKSVSFQETKMNENKEFISRVSAAISALAEKSKEIENILTVINGIAEQTNLLSLNAAIEAARAGEQGRGFAVVANEVRKLAEQSGCSVQKIEELITEVQADIDRAVQEMSNVEEAAAEQEKAMNETVRSFAGISEAVLTISENVKAVNEESSGIVENARKAEASIIEIANIPEEAAATTQQVSASTEEQANSVKSMLEMAEWLSGLAENLKCSIKHFTV